MPRPTGRVARWWHSEGERVVCTLCPRHCRIATGGRGFCFVRANFDGRLHLTTDARSSGFCIDPIEKKPLYHFYPGVPILSLGTAGCNLGCRFCQNWDLTKSRQWDRAQEEARADDVVEAVVAHGCPAVAFTYNDPTIWAEYAIDIARAAHRRGVATVAVTAGFIEAEARAELYRWIDAVNVDLKGIDDDFYRQYTGSRIAPVLETLRYLVHETDVWVELTNLVIPSANDSDDAIERLCAWVLGQLGDEIPLHFSAFHPDFKLRDRPATPPETLARAHDIATRAGVRHVYVGNVRDPERESTFCRRCGETLIGRDRYRITAYRLRGSQCSRCGTALPGRFANGEDGSLAERTTKGVRDTRRDECSAESSPRRVRTPGARGERAWGPRREVVRVTRRPRLEFSAEERCALVAATRAAVRRAVGGAGPSADPRSSRAGGSAARGGEPEGGAQRLAPELAEAPAFGLFVTLERGDELRACRGRWSGAGEAVFELGELLARTAREAALEDPRFPAIDADECDLLDIEISLMHSPEEIAARGGDRARLVEVGRHGLVIDHGAGRGLLLPRVASSRGWDAETFLDRLCEKAGLPTGTWREDDATVTRFQAVVIEGPAPVAEFRPAALTAAATARLRRRAAAAMVTPPAEVPDTTGLVELDLVRRERLGIVIAAAGPAPVVEIGRDVSWSELAARAGGRLRPRHGPQDGNTPPPRLSQAVLLWRALTIAPDDAPRRIAHHEFRCLVAEGPNAIAFEPKTTPESVRRALGAVGASMEDWRAGRVRMTSFLARSLPAPSGTATAGTARARPSAEAGQAASPVPPSPRAADTAAAGARGPAAGEAPPPRRPAAVAGTFYPADPPAFKRAIGHHLRLPPAAGLEQVRAVLLPHAGWGYCGDVLGAAIDRVEIPQVAIILGPHHTRSGANWSVAPEESWAFPDGEVPIARELGDHLVKAVDGIECESGAHEAEHGAEVIIPFLRARQPDLRVLPVVVGPAPLAELQRFGRGLHRVLEEAGGEVLLVISSDLNHFAPEARNRELDALALDALETGDPEQLLGTCQREDISMCGVHPAAVVLAALAESAPPRPERVAYDTSARMSGDHTRVVGYGSALIR